MHATSAGEVSDDRPLVFPTARGYFSLTLRVLWSLKGHRLTTSSQLLLCGGQTGSMRDRTFATSPPPWTLCLPPKSTVADIFTPPLGVRVRYGRLTSVITIFGGAGVLGANVRGQLF